VLRKTELNNNRIMKNDTPHDPTPIALDAARRIEKGDHPAAERLLGQALALDPNHCAALNARALLLARTGREPEALEVYRHILTAHAADPVAYCNLANLHRRAGRLDEALSLLERLFDKTSPGCRNASKAGALAHELCLRVQQDRAERDRAATAEVVEDFRRSIERTTGFWIEVVPGEVPGDYWVGTQTDWRGCRHRIRYSRSFPSLLRPHLLADSYLRFEMHVQTRKAGKSRLLATTPASQPTIDRLLSLPQPQFRQLTRKGFDPGYIAGRAKFFLEMLLETLYRCSLDLIVQSRLRERLPALAPVQFLAMERDLSAAPDPAQMLRLDLFCRRDLARAALAFNGVRVLLHASLSANTSPLPMAYAQTEVSPLVSELWACWRSIAPSLGTGDEDRLVDAFARITGLEGAYEWITDAPADWLGERLL
jgi:hypothetical protein